MVCGLCLPSPQNKFWGYGPPMAATYCNLYIVNSVPSLPDQNFVHVALHEPNTAFDCNQWRRVNFLWGGLNFYLRLNKNNFYLTMYKS